MVMNATGGNMKRISDQEIAEKLDSEYPDTKPDDIFKYREVMKKSIRFIAQAQLEADKEWVLKELDLAFALAPNDDAYLRIMVNDIREEIRTGLRAAERQDLKRKKAGYL